MSKPLAKAKKKAGQGKVRKAKKTAAKKTPRKTLKKTENPKASYNFFRLRIDLPRLRLDFVGGAKGNDAVAEAMLPMSSNLRVSSGPKPPSQESSSGISALGRGPGRPQNARKERAECLFLPLSAHSCLGRPCRSPLQRSCAEFF